MEFSMRHTAVSKKPDVNSASYSASGFVSKAMFLNDATCRSPTLTYGFPVNKCVVEANFAYILRLKSGINNVYL